MSIPASVEKLPIGPRKGKARARDLEEGIHEDAKVDADVGVGGPSLDFGRPGGASLVRSTRGWEWAWAKREDKELILEHGTPELLVPPTRSTDPKMGSDTLLSTITQSANDVIRSAVDKYEHLGLDELILSDLEEAHSELRKPRYDPFRGNVLEVIHNPRAKYAKTMLAFAIGEVGQDLNISPFLPKSFASKSNLNLTELQISPDPMASFPTQILQICASSAQVTGLMDREATGLIVRLHSSVHWLHVLPNQAFVNTPEGPCATTIRVASIETSETDGRRIVDCAMDPNAWGKAVLIDEAGGVWIWHEERVEVKERLEKALRLTKIRNGIDGVRESFWRIGYGPKDDTIVFLSEREAVMIDLLNPDRFPVVIMSLTGEGRFFTSLYRTMAARKASLITLCTTHEIMWIDEMHPGMPALSWKHHYGGGKLRDLDINVVAENGTYRTLLSSPSYPLVMVYTIADSILPESTCRPYCLPLPSKLRCVASMASLELLRLGRPSSTLWITMGPNGAIWGTPLFKARESLNTREERPMRPARMESNWNRTVAEAKQRQKIGDIDDVGLEGQVGQATRYKTVNARWAWLELHSEQNCDSQLYVDEYERYLREFDAPLHHWVTPAELARDAVAATGDLEEAPTRFAPLSLDADSFLDFDETKFGKHLHQISTFPVASSLPATFPALVQRLTAAYPSSPQMPRQAAAHLKQNIHRLALDLAFSSMILSVDTPPILPVASVPPQQDQKGPDEFLSRAANLTLNEREPPPLSFSILPPRSPIPLSPSRGSNSPSASSDESTPAQAEERLQSLPIRSILADWTIGANPADYTWKAWRAPVDPIATFSGASGTRGHMRPIKPLPSPRSAQPPIFASQQVPVLLSATQPPTLGGTFSLAAGMGHAGRFRARSGSPALRPEDEAVDLPMTQIERGPFGGRNVESKKKKGKKRAGGF